METPVLDASLRTLRAPRALRGPWAACIGAALALLASCARPPQQPDVLLVTVDTLRRDRMSVYGYERETTPRLDEYAGHGLVFTRVQSPRAKTTPAVASMLTGLYPHDHGVRDLASPLDSRVPVLAESFRRAGYRTIGVIGNWVLSDDRSGLARGFQTWDEALPDTVGVPPDDVPQRRAASMTDAALAVLDLDGPPAPEGDRAPWFCWLHYMDPHGIYDPPQEHAVFESEADRLPSPESLAPHAIHKPRLADYNIPPGAVTPEGGVDLAFVRDLYDAEIRYVDAEVGRLFDALRARGRFDETLIFLTSDHGESLGEHSYWFEHGFYTYEVTCGVPLVAWIPPVLVPRAPPGALVGHRSGDLSLVDLAPTLLDLAGLPRMPTGTLSSLSSFRGRSRTLDVVLEDRGGEPVFSEKIERTDISGTVQHKAVRIGRWKLIHRLARLPRGPEALRLVTEELYDVDRDPLETENLAARVPADAPLELLREELAAFVAADDGLGELAGLLQRQREDLERNDPEGLRVLEALGY